MDENKIPDSLDDKLYKVKCNADEVSHLKADRAECNECVSKICEIICPAGVYEWDDMAKTLIINYENCLECGACRIACEKKCLKWEYPRGGKGVVFKYG